MKKLITMSEYVILQGDQDHKPGDDFNYYFERRVRKYAQLLQTPLELGQFVACGKDGVTMEKPDVNVITNHTDSCECSTCITYYSQYGKWEEAQSHVLFDGCELKGYLNTSNKPVYVCISDGNQLGNKLSANNENKLSELLKTMTIEYLINSGIELKPTEALKNQLSL